MDSPLVFDTLISIDVPEGVSETGRAEIEERLVHYKLSIPKDWEWTWTTSKGNLTKRIERLAKEQGLTLPTALIAKLGEIAQEHSVDPITYYIKVTKNLNWNAGDFGDHGSCFWGGKESNRLLLQDNNGYAIQFFNEKGQGLGRCFGFELEPPLQVIFNAYGRMTGNPLSVESLNSQERVEVQSTGRRDISLVRIANIFALHLGQGSYRRVKLVNGRDDGGGELFINSDSGYIIGPWNLIRRIGLLDLGLKNPNSVPCSSCGRLVDKLENTVVLENDQRVCAHCFRERYIRCAHCEQAILRNEAKVCDGNYWCSSCVGVNGRKCTGCGENYRLVNMYHREYDRSWWCRDCFYRHSMTCPGCHQAVPAREIPVSVSVCHKCSAKGVKHSPIPKASRAQARA